jgi:hypothetical protein
MLESGSYADFVQEAVRAERSREFRAKNLERDWSAMTKVVCEIDRRHAAPAEFTLDSVAVGKGGFEGSGIWQWACGRSWLCMVQQQCHEGQRAIRLGATAG